MIVDTKAKFCEHFLNLKVSKSWRPTKNPSCKFCLWNRSNLWACLARGCQADVCSRNSNEHLISHLEVVGPLQNSEGHKRANKGLVGIFSTRHSHIITSCIQFIAHAHFLFSILLDYQPQPLKLPSKRRVLIFQLKQVVRLIRNADSRIIRAQIFNYKKSYRDQVVALLYELKPQLQSYTRKNPFNLIQYLISQIHEELIYYTLIDHCVYSSGRDQWDLYGTKGMIKANSPLYKILGIEISLNYRCPKCHHKFAEIQTINFVKLVLPKKRKKIDQIEKELEEMRYESPTKNKNNRGRSLITRIFAGPDSVPLTIPELLQDFLSQQLKSQRECPNCPNTKAESIKTHFNSLPQMLIFQIHRFYLDGYTDITTEIHLQTNFLDMGPFTNNPSEQILYEFEEALLIDSFMFPVLTKSKHNKQLYWILNDICRMLPKADNVFKPYIIVYKKKPILQNITFFDFYKQVTSLNQTEPYTTQQQIIQNAHVKDQVCLQYQYQLPDFYFCLLVEGWTPYFDHQIVCKHRYLKPKICSKSASSKKYLLNKNQYSFLCDKSQINMYTPEVCKNCINQIQQIQQRKQKQKQMVLKYDRMQNFGQCMVNSVWIAKWSSYLYGTQTKAYFQKGIPFPGAISNLTLLEGQKCRENLVKNVDYKVMGIQLWRLLKELYGGGPEIRYKWKNMNQKLDESFTKMLKADANALREIYRPLNFEQSTSVKRSFYEISSLGQSLPDQTNIPHEEIDIEIAKKQS